VYRRRDLERVSDSNRRDEPHFQRAKILDSHPVRKKSCNDPGRELTHCNDSSESRCSRCRLIVMQRIEVAAGASEPDDVRRGDRADPAPFRSIARA
jgi:hypothetical protein